MSRISCTPTKLLLQQRPLLSRASRSLALRKHLITLPQPAAACSPTTEWNRKKRKSLADSFANKRQ
jgi:hypothetical protein